MRPDLDGNAIMEFLGVPPGPIVGAAWRHLKELRLERGPLSRDEAERELRRWAADQCRRPRPCRRGRRVSTPRQYQTASRHSRVAAADQGGHRAWPSGGSSQRRGEQAATKSRLKAVSLTLNTRPR